MALSQGHARPAAAATTPIQHVIIIEQENHSFDNVLARLCDGVAKATITRPGLNMGCSYALSGRISTGATIALSQASDIAPPVNHGMRDQVTAIHGGAMDHFDLIKGCTSTDNYACFTAYAPSQIPNLAALAEKFVISDATFETTLASSWVSHVSLVTSQTDGFNGENPPGSDATTGPGWGCDSNKDAKWVPPTGGSAQNQPACVPDYTLDSAQFPYGGAYRATAVRHIPTILDELDAAGISWHLYAGNGYGATTSSGYHWTVCPTFAECLYHTSNGQAAKWVAASQVITDAKAGTLPAVSIVTPSQANSQHNNDSMQTGDNWIGKVVNAIMQGADWSSSAIFIKYDDCGCFYDHVPPPGKVGPREPMVIVSPYARSGYTDSSVASMNGVLAYIEHAFGLAALTTADGNAYDFANSFDYSQVPLTPVTMVNRPISASEQRWIDAHPPDPNDPT